MSQNAPPQGSGPPTPAGPLPSEGRLPPHSGGPGRAGYPFFGRQTPFTTVGGKAEREKPSIDPVKAAQMDKRRPPPLARGPRGQGPFPEVRGGVTDFYGAPSRIPQGPLQPPIFNQFREVKKQGPRQEVNDALNQTVGNTPLHVGSHGWGASHNQAPISTTEPFHPSPADPQWHATMEMPRNFSKDGTTHLFADGLNTHRAPGPAGQGPNPTFIHNPGPQEVADAGRAAYTAKVNQDPRFAAENGIYQIPPGTNPVQETNQSGNGGSVYPDPSRVVAAGSYSAPPPPPEQEFSAQTATPAPHERQ